MASWERIGRTEPMTAFINPKEDWGGQKLPERIRHRLPNIEVWPQWPHCVSFFDILKQLAVDPLYGDDDYLVHLDNDTVFLTPEVLSYINGLDIYGFPGEAKLPSPRLGQWSWFSGFCIFLKVSALRRMVQTVHFDQIGGEVRAIGGSHIFDVVIPYAMEATGATRGNLSWTLTDQDIQSTFRGTKAPGSLVHLVGMWETFLGRPCNKWGIPKVLEEAGGFAKLLEVYKP